LKNSVQLPVVSSQRPYIKYRVATANSRLTLNKIDPTAKPDNDLQITRNHLEADKLKLTTDR
jgi:hypothetical protein